MVTSASSSPVSLAPGWLLEAILAGEQESIARIAKAGDVPAELRQLYGESPPAEGLAACSAALRRICAAEPTAGQSCVLAAVSILRLSALGHDDAAWSELIPRWLGPSLMPAERGLGLLALALLGRDRLCADDYAELMDEAILLLPEDAPLRGAHIYQYALYLGLRGMLQRITAIVDLPHPGDQEPEIGPDLLAECFYDAVCCGRTAQAAFLERRFAATPEAAWQLGLIHLHQVHLPVFTAIANRTPLPATGESPSLPLMHALLGSDSDLLDAFEVDGDADEISPLLGYDALRIALARRDHAAARTILERRALNSSRHWLDDLFLARLLLLEDRLREAGVAFARLEASAARYGAIERVEIELRLAAELSRHDCCRLGLLAGGLPSQVTSSRAE